MAGLLNDGKTASLREEDEENEDPLWVTRFIILLLAYIGCVATLGFLSRGAYTLIHAKRV